MEPEEKRYDIDPFRGVVCLSLVMLHFYSWNLHEVLFSTFGNKLEFFIWNVRPGVESFFVLAGFMVAHTLRPIPGQEVSYRAYFLRRCVRLLIPYTIAVLLATANGWLPKLLGIGEGKLTYTFPEVLAQLFLVQELFSVHEAAVGYWSLITLEHFYILWLICLAVIRVLVRNRESRLNVQIGLAAVLGFASLGCCLSQREFILKLFTSACYLFLGVLVYHSFLRDSSNALSTELSANPLPLEVKPQGLAQVAALSLGLGVLIVGVLVPDNRAFKACAAAAILALIAHGLEFPRNWFFEALRFIGKRSYSIYLMHGIVGFRVLSFWPKFEKYGVKAAIGLIILALIASLIASLLFYRYVEVPCLNAARRIRYRANPGTDAG